MLSNTRIGESVCRTDLGNAFRNPPGLGSVEQDWLNRLRLRAHRSGDPDLLQITEQMLKLLGDCRDSNWQKEFLRLYDKARRHAYPLSMRLQELHWAEQDLTNDYQLKCFDLGLIRQIEDDAFDDMDMAGFVRVIQKHLSRESAPLSYNAIADAMTVYGEALVYLMLKWRGRDELTIQKIREADDPSPDFACSLKVPEMENRQLEFFIEVKTLDIVNAEQRFPQILYEGMETEISIDDQQAAGAAIAVAEQEFQPYRPFDPAAEYDPRSIQQVINTLCSKALSAFTSKQFQSGPTFALASLLRLPLPGQNANALAPIYYDPAVGGACVSGVLWHLAFCRRGAPVFCYPEFEGAGNREGDLQQDGFLVNEQNQDVAGLLVLSHQQDYRIDGLYDRRWSDKSQNWSGNETEAVFRKLCDCFNGRENEMAHDLSYVRGVDDP